MVHWSMDVIGQICAIWSVVHGPFVNITFIDRFFQTKTKKLYGFNLWE